MTRRLFWILSLTVGLVACSESAPEPEVPSVPVEGTRLDTPAPVPTPVDVAKTNPTPEPKALAPDAPTDPVAPPIGPGESLTQLQPHQKLDEETAKVPEVPGYAGITFSKLGGFKYDEDEIDYDALPAPVVKGEGASRIEISTLDPAKDKQVPKAILEMGGKKIALVGYMIPVDFLQGKTNEFVLTPIIPSCFFCQKPQLNEWIHVTTKGGKRVEYPGDGPIVVHGTLAVGLQVEDGFPVNLYRMEAHGVKEKQIPEPEDSGQ